MNVDAPEYHYNHRYETLNKRAPVELRQEQNKT